VARFNSWQKHPEVLSPAMGIHENEIVRPGTVSLAYIIVTHNSASHLQECLEHISATPHDDVVIVDNDSSDNTIEIARQFGASIYELPENVGYGQAANIGAQISHCTALCFINPDCLVDGETVTDALAVLGNQPTSCVVPDLREGTNIVHGKQEGYTPLKLFADMCEINNYRPELLRVLRRHEAYSDADWFWPLGACMFINRETFFQIGGYDERYFMYMEDVDFGQRLYENDMRIVRLNRTVLHYAQAGSDISLEKRRDLLNQGRLRYAKTHYGSEFCSALQKLVPR
jgi:GT2 family glycosyltransferase